LLVPFYSGTGQSNNNDSLSQAALTLAKWLVEGNGKGLVWTRNTYELFYREDKLGLLPIKTGLQKIGDLKFETLQGYLEVRNQEYKQPLLEITSVHQFKLKVGDKEEDFLTLCFKADPNNCRITVKVKSIRQCFKQLLGFAEGNNARYPQKISDFYQELLQKAKNDEIALKLRKTSSESMRGNVLAAKGAQGQMSIPSMVKGYCILNTLLNLTGEECIMDPTGGTGVTLRIGYLVEKYLKEKETRMT
jgi:hypothetical protein